MSGMRLSQVVNYGSLLVVLTAAACSEDPIGPGEPPDTPGEPFDTLAGLVVSEAIVEPSRGDGAAGLAYVSLPPEKLRFGGSVQIQNLTARAPALLEVPVIDGGFDPVAVPASSGDQLQLTIRNVSTRVVGATVPDRLAPVIVRTSVQQSSDEVADDPRPRVVFSEPIDAGTLPRHVRIARGATLVSDRFAIVPGEPWAVELDPEVELEPMTTYELNVDAAIRDLAGEPLQAPLTVTFSTLFEVGGVGRVAFVSDRDGGEFHIYVIDPDGTGPTRVAAGWSPAWSPDGTRIAFYRNGIHVIDADGSDERLLVANGHAPAWSPDGRRVAFERGGVDLYVVNTDGSQEALLVSGLSVSTEMGINAELRSPAWSPDGQRVAFSTTEGSILFAHADGSGIRRLRLDGEEFHLAFLSEPAWSPDGSRIAFTIDNSKIASAALDGSDVRVHTEPGYGPEWSADGKYLVYHYLVQTGECDWHCPARIRVVDLATGRFRRLVPEVPGAHPGYSDTSPVWSR